MNNGTHGDIPGSNQALMPPCWSVGKSGTKWAAFFNGRFARRFTTRAAAIRYVWGQYDLDRGEAEPEVEDIDAVTLRRLRAHREEAGNRCG